jgi:hypothetical protein
MNSRLVPGPLAPMASLRSVSDVPILSWSLPTALHAESTCVVGPERNGR